ncbi:hypothetical protein [Gloeobacter morelensis]|uniref:Glycine zipper domain-containing protein n=1 Tax=Gloeobacter morelensis MG652769 TaxID=2781736 RepID=A0ABY3PHK0_9CYAN|nr:hypothetical protein [Gloeobacter morelensis]UFP93151.1 hypothetical protein ISF26_15220 [Gloeobacter morelensis MG652769]
MIPEDQEEFDPELLPESSDAVCWAEEESLFGAEGTWDETELSEDALAASEEEYPPKLEASEEPSLFDQAVNFVSGIFGTDEPQAEPIPPPEDQDDPTKWFDSTSALLNFELPDSEAEAESADFKGLPVDFSELSSGTGGATTEFLDPQTSGPTPVEDGELLTSVDAQEGDASDSLLEQVLERAQDIKVVSPIPFLDTAVRKVDPDAASIFDPTHFGMTPSDPSAVLQPAEHALNQHAGGGSPYLSASERPFGAPNIEGKPYWIDLEQTRAAGAETISNAELVANMDELAQQNPSMGPRANMWKAAQAAEGEMLIKGNVPPAAIESGSMRALKGLGTAAGVLGAGMTAYDLYQAGQESIEEASVAPIAAEGVRQVGGWAGAWAGAQAGAGLGALAGVTTGPGAILTGLAGGVIGGIAGFAGADWIADQIHPDEQKPNG